MVLKGDTSNLLLADIFQTLAQNGQSGMLTLRGTQLERRILFAPTGVTPYDATVYRAPRLGHLLIAAAKVGGPDIEAVLQEIDREGPNPHSAIALLVILDEKGLLSLDEGVRVLRTEVMEDLFDIFLVDEEMEFEFEDDEVPCESIPRECFFRVEEVVMEAARRLDDQQRMRDVVDREEYYVMTQPAPETDPVAGLLDGSNTVIDIAERLAQSRFDVARWVFGLGTEQKIRAATADELIRSARRLDPIAQRLKVTRLCQRALGSLNDEDSRLDEIGDMLIRASSNRLAIEVLLKRVHTLLDQGNQETAYAQVVRARDLDPNHIGVLKTLAHMHQLRGEKAEEAKVLTTLAERSAAEQRFDDAVEYAARVAEVLPDSTLLDHSFLLYCQKAERHQFGAEVLSQAAAKRNNPTRAALLYNGILLLDPTRSDVKKLLSKHERGRKRSRVFWLAGGVLMLPVLAVVVHVTMGRLDSAKLVGYVESAEKLLANDEPQLALMQIQDLLTADLDSELSERIGRLKQQIDSALGEQQKAERSEREQSTRDVLASLQKLIDEGSYAGALRRIADRLENTDALAPEERKRLLGKLPIIRQAAESEWQSLNRLATQFAVPATDAELLDARERFSAPFSADRRFVWEDLDRAVSDFEKTAETKESLAALDAAATAVLALFEQLRPGLDELNVRIARNEALDVLSDDYQDILDAERRGDFAQASRGYERLLRDYGEGSLRTFLEQRTADTKRIHEVLTDVEARIRKQDVAGAHELARQLAADTAEYDLLEIVGVPVRLTTVPPAAQLADPERVLGPSPQIYYARRKATSLTASAPGFVATEQSVSAESGPEVLIGLQRKALMEVKLATRVEVEPLSADGKLFIGARDGVLYRVDLSGSSQQEPVQFSTESLTGIPFCPLSYGDLVIVCAGEGQMFGIDRATMRPRWTRKLAGPPVGSPILIDQRVFVVAREGQLHEIQASNGESRVIATIEESPSCGPAAVGSTLAVGTTDGRVVAVSQVDGHLVFRTRRQPQPMIGITADDRRFIAADDSGRVVALDARLGTESWSVSSGAALAAPPRAMDGLVVVAVGSEAVVLDSDNGRERQRVEATDWIASTPTLAGGRLYVGDRAGRLRAFDYQTGQLLFQHAVDSSLEASPVVLRQGLVLTSEEGTVTLVGN